MPRYKPSRSTISAEDNPQAVDRLRRQLETALLQATKQLPGQAGLSANHVNVSTVATFFLRAGVYSINTTLELS